VCEALACGLPVVGLDASGTRDLVVDSRTGLLLRTQNPSEWNVIFADSSSTTFQQIALEFSLLLGKLVFDRHLRTSMSRRAVEEGVVGRAWGQAMNTMVDCYREAIAISGERQPKSPLGDHYPSSTTWHLSLQRYIFMFFIFLGSFGVAYRLLPGGLLLPYVTD
jgi:hypothetical protein